MTNVSTVGPIPGALLSVAEDSRSIYKPVSSEDEFCRDGESKADPISIPLGTQTAVAGRRWLQVHQMCTMVTL